MADFEDYFLFILDNYFRIYVWPCSITEKLELHQLWINGLLCFLLDVGRGLASAASVYLQLAMPSEPEKSR
ncbi:unnamed protein product [Gadus morhua 'NCC']